MFGDISHVWPGTSYDDKDLNSTGFSIKRVIFVISGLPPGMETQIGQSKAF